jgi:hypothetical protein
MKNGSARAGLRIATSGGRQPGPVLITGGAGFIGTNLAHRLLSRGRPSSSTTCRARRRAEPALAARARTAGCCAWSSATCATARAVAARVTAAAGSFHLAAQVAVTTSLLDPLHDFEVNARGTLNLLEAPEHAERAAAAALHLHQQGLRRLEDVALEPSDGRRYQPAGRGACARRASTSRGRSTSTAPTAARRAPPTSTSSTTRAPSACRRRVPHELHLRPAPVRHRGPGLGRALPDPRAARRADHALRRRQAGARRALRRGPGRRARVRCSRPMGTTSSSSTGSWTVWRRLTSTRGSAASVPT